MRSLTCPPSRRLVRLARRPPADLTVDHLLEVFGGGWPVPVLVFAAAGMIPSPGVPLGMICGGVLMLHGAAVLLGGELPRGLARARVRGDLLRKGAGAVLPWLRRIERFLRPRWPALACPPRFLGALATIAMGFLIWLPIPFGNFLPGLALCVLALGVIARDGKAVAAGLGLSVVAGGVAALLASLGGDAIMWMFG